MSEYQAPLKDIRFTLNQICDLEDILSLPKFAENDGETINAVLEEAGRLAAGVLAPLNRQGDTQGATLANGVVTTPDGFAEAYAAYRDGGWNGIQFDPNYGGMGLPLVIGNACSELWNSANMGFSLCPMLTQGAIDAIGAHGSDELKETYLEKLVTGHWTGTMNLTEPQAGSDVGALRAKAEPAADGSWRIKGQKIFITYGEHDYADNIIHLVLARTPGSPEGTRGISLFVVPKFLVNPDGSLGQRNDLRCINLEEKLGIHASPTAVMSFGDNEGAVGYMLGEENKGMRCMFTMMNTARLSVGIEGLAIAEGAYQHAVAYALERRQGRAIGATEPGASAIVEHADVRRMLMTMKAQIDAMRALCYVNGQALDLARNDEDEERRAWYGQLAELLTPLSKAWSTDLGCEVASLGVQIHGGMGFIEETGAAQYYRDARIAPIYEGTNGIQALDLVMRKLTMAGGDVVRRYLGEMRGLDQDLAQGGAAFAKMRTNLTSALDGLEEASRWLLESMASDPNAVAAGATPYLRMFGMTVGGYLLAKGALAAAALADQPGADTPFLAGRVATARFFGEQILPQAPALLAAITAGAEPLYAIPPEQLVN
ncbi:MAG: acyl-CoA dehydrogenase [Rhodospirillaceae bacterium]|jgi:3-(methylthio)propanoyl-CoA dehydrogenase|nr:acyl-CoA dehydrogenase [Rhodospirillaceae bacterium]MBT3493232.1 acyl-CoA dehydrogenase [Rhodospirillaceae bacterium]MBT3782134.1 acyl-CoA dehydrogenase [Rhodospirillaceae bacterium]MBT3977653.1 acyl-CoA dehydrogenase [Rhodospirillaceae bacterium]MBT4167690.1 acyl-CoA dehydrogenase [Rhodospirillaceae bacterium]